MYGEINYYLGLDFSKQVLNAAKPLIDHFVSKFGLLGE